jgi:hypothetical protein
MSVVSHGRHGGLEIKLCEGPDPFRDHACAALPDPVNFAAVAPVAQLDRVLRFERSGRRFESVRARQKSRVCSGWYPLFFRRRHG